MADNPREIIMNFAGRLCDKSSGQSALDYAVERGWLTEAGEPTPSGRDAADAFAEQLKTRSAFRIG